MVCTLPIHPDAPRTATFTTVISRSFLNLCDATGSPNDKSYRTARSRWRHDTILDFELGNANEKIDLSALTVDGQTPDWEAAMIQIGTNVLITTGADSSLNVKNADIATLYEYHLIA